MRCIILLFRRTINTPFLPQNKTPVTRALCSKICNFAASLKDYQVMENPYIKQFPDIMDGKTIL